MRRKVGTLFMLLGAALIIGALSLFLMNQHEDRMAGESSQEMLFQIQQEIARNQQRGPTEPNLLDNIPVEMLDPEDLVMTERIINGYPCIGYISIPDLLLQLPVITDWNGKKLQTAPCRFSGTLRGEDLVIMAHSYDSHFGRLHTLTEGSEIQFTDMDGNVWNYEVAVMDVLDAYAVEEMTAGEYDLTLFTCTTDHHHRVTVRCNRIEQ